MHPLEIAVALSVSFEIEWVTVEGVRAVPEAIKFGIRHSFRLKRIPKICNNISSCYSRALRANSANFLVLPVHISYCLDVVALPGSPFNPSILQPTSILYIHAFRGRRRIFWFWLQRQFWWINGAGAGATFVVSVGILASNKGVVTANGWRDWRGPGQGYAGGVVASDLLRVVCLIRRAWRGGNYVSARCAACVLHSQNAERWLYARGSLILIDRPGERWKLTLNWLRILKEILFDGGNWDRKKK